MGHGKFTSISLVDEYYRLKSLKAGDFCLFIQNPYSGTWTRTREPRPKEIPSLGPVLGNLDPYLGTLNLTRTRLCTQVSEYN